MSALSYSAAAVSPGDDASKSDPVVVGAGPYRYRADAGWARLPAECSWREAVAVACDSMDRVYVFNRGDHPVLVFNRDGTCLRSFGEGLITRAHGIIIGPDDAVYCTDDCGHSVRKFTPDGRLLMTLGVPGQPSETGATSMDFRTIRKSGGPFHYPTNVALDAEGNLYVTDGYGNARLHRFSAAGRLEMSWGEPGSGPGEFGIPHGIAIDHEGLVYVADRENSRIQVFTREGRFVRQLTDLARPCEVALNDAGHLFVAELGYRVAMWPGIDAPVPDPTGGRVSVLDAGGEVLSRWGGGDHPTAPGDFFAPHDICVDSKGDLYVSEVVMSAGGDAGRVPATCHSLQKFWRVESGEQA